MKDYPLHIPHDVFKYRIHLRTHERHISIDPEEILFCKAEGSYTRVYIINCKEILISRPLKAFVKYVPEFEFIRCHHSYLINISRVNSFDSRKNTVILGNHHLPISRRKATGIFTILSKSGIPDIHHVSRI